MAEGGETQKRVIQNAPTILKVDVWAYFSFYEQTGKHELDKTHTVCNACHTQIKYLGNTTNLRNHIRCFHSEMLMPASAKADPAQPKIDQTISTLPPNSGKGKRITRSVAAFITKDIRPYSVVNNPGFRHLLKMLELWYKLPSGRQDNGKGYIWTQHHETKVQVMASMSQANQVAIMRLLDFGHGGGLCNINGTLR